MTIDEIIKKENEIAAEYQKVVDNHIVNDDGLTLEEMYCDDSEAINEQLSLCKSLADYHKQIANVMSKYQKITEIVDDWKSDGGAFEMSELYWLRLISEVIEDGDD